MDRKTTALLLLAGAVALAIFLQIAKPTPQATPQVYTETKYVEKVKYVERLYITVVDPGDLKLAEVLNATVTVANFTDPYSVVQAVWGAKRVGAKLDVLIAYWSPYIALLADAGVILPIDAPGGPQYRGKTWGVPISVEAPAVICNKSILPKPPTLRDLENLTVAIYLDPVVLSGFIYSEGGSYYNGSLKALADPKTQAGFRTIQRLLAKAPPHPENYTAQLQAFLSGKAACIVDGPWINIPRDKVWIIPFNKSLAYYKAAYALTPEGKKLLEQLPALWPKLEALGYTTPAGTTPFSEAARRAEPPPVPRAGLSDAVLATAAYILGRIAQGEDPKNATSYVIGHILSEKLKNQ